MSKCFIPYFLLVFFLITVPEQKLISQSVQKSGQEESKPNGFMAFGAEYGLVLPGGDFKDRFGSSYLALVSAGIYSKKWNGMFGVETGLLFGNTVKEDVLAPYRISSGALLGQDGNPGDIFLRLRGNYLGLYTNKTILPFRSNSAAGLNIGVGAGLLQHKVRILNDSDNIGQIVADYEKGYDRLTRGLALKQSLSYQHLSTKRSVNYCISLTIYQGFTESVRQINFDTGENAKGKRLDVLISLNAKWYIPLAQSNDRSTGEVFY